MFFLVLFLSGVLVAADQFTKYLVVEHIKPEGPIVVIKNFFELVYVENRGAAFGMLQDQRAFFIGITAGMVLVAAVLLLVYKKHTWASWCSGVLIISGGIGNLIDRVLNGFVVDFLSFSFFPPVFNFADCCVTVGAGMLILHILFGEKLSHKKKIVVNDTIPDEAVFTEETV